MSHANAVLTPTGRLRLARLIVDEGWVLRRAAERLGVSVTTARRWSERYRLHGRAGAGDSPEFSAVLEAIKVASPTGPPRRRPGRVLADKAYSSRKNRAWLRDHRIQATIPTPADQAAHRKRRGSKGGRPPAFDTDRYKDRHAVECGINKLKHHRAFATRYDKLAVR